jgi:predicted amidohydrolase
MRFGHALVYSGWGFLLAMAAGFSQGKAQEPAPGPPVPVVSEPRATVKVAGVLLKWIRGDKAANYRRVEPMIRAAAGLGARIVCTTECFLDGYAIADKSIPLEVYRALGERIPEGPYCQRLMKLADELDIFLVAGMLEAEDTHRYNTAVLIGPDGSLRGKYHKQELGHELVRNTPGAVSRVFDTPLGRMGVLICADRNQKAIVEGFRVNGAEFLICPSGGMFGPVKNDPIVQARSRENHTSIVFVHPAEFLVTAPDGTIAKRVLLGDQLLIRAEEEGTAVDRNAVVTFDLPVPATSDRPRPVE